MAAPGVPSQLASALHRLAGVSLAAPGVPSQPAALACHALLLLPPCGAVLALAPLCKRETLALLERASAMASAAYLPSGWRSCPLSPPGRGGCESTVARLVLTGLCRLRGLQRCLLLLLAADLSIDSAEPLGYVPHGLFLALGSSLTFNFCSARTCTSALPPCAMQGCSVRCCTRRGAGPCLLDRRFFGRLRLALSTEL